MAARSPKHFANGYVGPHRHPSASCFPKATEAANNSLAFFLGYTSPFWSFLETSFRRTFRFVRFVRSATFESVRLPGSVRVGDRSDRAAGGQEWSGRDAGRNLGGSKGSSAKIPKAPCHFTSPSQRTRARSKAPDQIVVKAKRAPAFSAQNTNSNYEGRWQVRRRWVVFGKTKEGGTKVSINRV